MKRISWLFCLLPMLTWGDSIKLKDGQTMTGIVRAMEGGKVTIEIGGQRRVVELLRVAEIDFDSPHADEAPKVADIPVREFTNDAQKLVKAQQDSRRMLDQIKARWSTRKSVEPGQAGQWRADKERFSTPLADYRKAIHQMYLDVASHVENYNKLTDEANRLYVGVRGLLNIGSALTPEEPRPLKEFMPGQWYDQIYYDAYRKGFNDAVEFQALTPR